MIHDVFLNGTGPYQMLVDTGNASSIVRPAIARRLNLAAAYTVDRASIAGTRRVPVAILEEVRVGPAVDRSVEALIGEVSQDGVDGVLGQSWLARHDYLLDYRGRRIWIDGSPGGPGIRVPLQTADGRPTVMATVDGRSRELVVDSGASALVLFEKPSIGPLDGVLQTHGGRTDGQRCSVQVAIAGDAGRLMDAVRVDVSGLGPGLLPTSRFASVFVSNHQRFVQFGR